MLSSLMRPSGGLRYHWRAFRHSPQWGSFTIPLAQWLDAWHPRADRLLLVGPSAGWCLPDLLFERFRAIDVLEPDPLGWLVLSRRLKHLGIHARWHEADYLTDDPVRVEQLAVNFPDSAVLFCNVLGQLRFTYPTLDDPEQAQLWKAVLMHSLAGREWATFHDRLSGPVPPRVVSQPAVSTVGMSDEQLAATFYDNADGQLLSHGMDGILPHLTRRYFGWEIVPGQYHLIEAVRND